MRKIQVVSRAGVARISAEDAHDLFGSAALQAGELRGEIVTHGPWQITKSYKAIAVTATWTNGFCGATVDTYTIYGKRTLTSPRQSGYSLEGWVSIGGKKHSSFTSSILFELPDKSLINVAVIFART